MKNKKSMSVADRILKNIGEITFADANDSNLKRDNANIDGDSPMGMMLQYGSTVSKEYCFEKVINRQFSKMHNNGDIHIHDADFINIGTLTCCQIDLDKLFRGGFNTGHGYLREPNDIISYGALTSIALQANQNSQHGGQSIPAIDFYLAPGVKKTFVKLYYENLRKALELFTNSSLTRLDSFKNNYTYNHSIHPQMHINPDFDIQIRGLLYMEFGLEVNIIEKILEFSYRNTLNDTETRTHQAMEALVHNLNTMHSRSGSQVPFTSLNFGTDTSPEGRMVSKNLLLAQEEGLGKGETPIFPILIFKVKEGINYNVSDPNYDLFKLACRVSARRLFPNFSFLDAPFNKQFYVLGKPETEIAYMGCRTRVASNIKGDNVVTGRGNISFTSINLPRLGIEFGIPKKGIFDEQGFYKKLDETIEICIEQLLERYKIQGSKKVKNFPFLMGQGIWRNSENLGLEEPLSEVIKQGTLTIGFIGLAECLTALIGKHHGESDEAQQLGIKIVSHMREKMDLATERLNLNFSLIATPAEGLSGRFRKIDKKKYGKIGGVTDREYYTNSFHIPVYFPISAFEKIQREAPYHELTNGGHITYVEMDGDPVNNLDAFEAIVRCMKEAGVGYGSINHPVDRDPICGYAGVIKDDICPKCGRNVSEIKKVKYKLKRVGENYEK